MKEFLLITVLLTFLELKQSNSFSVQKRRVEGPSDLQSALKVLQRKRRRIDDSDLRNRLYGDIPDSYLPYDEYIPYRDDYPEEDPEALSDQYVLANMLNSYPTQYIDDADNNRDQTTDTETPTIEELKQMFDEIDEKDIKQKEKIQSDSESDKGEDKISQQQMDELLSEAVKVPPANSKSKDGDVKENSPEPVSTDELKDVFKETKTTKQLGDNKAKIKSIGEEFVNSNQGNGLSKKKKRMTKRDNSAKDSLTNADETLLDLVQENQELRGMVNRLKLVEYLEDKENDYLASALKDATLAQLRNTETYLAKEYGEIQRALEIEQTLQDIKESDPDEEADEDVEPTEIKRSGAPYEDNLGVWYDQPVKDEGDAQQKLEDFVKQYRQTYDLDNIDDDGEDTLPVQPPVIPTSEDVCPQLDLLSSNCAVAALLDIDDEARDLCNRHEICYICGATLGLSGHDCDGGFRSETVQRCGSSHCIQSGAEFLWFIKQDHKYSASYLAQCDAPCVRKYIVGQ